MSNVNIKIFPNGLTLAHSYQDIDIVSLLIGVKIGSTNDGDKLGISHLLEHMMFKGTTTRNSYELSLILEKLGAGTNAFTGYASTAYYLQIHYLIYYQTNFSILLLTKKN